MLSINPSVPEGRIFGTNLAGLIESKPEVLINLVTSELIESKSEAFIKFKNVIFEFNPSEKSLPTR